MTKIKICGITNLEDAIISVVLGADALGFVFYKKSPRYILPKKAKEIISVLPKKIAKVGVFVNAKEKDIKNTARTCKLDVLQLHGDEAPEFCGKFKGYKVVKAFRIKDRLDLAQVKKYKTFAYMFDAFSAKQFGGTGKKFNWKLLGGLKDIKKPVFLSGGLNAANVKEAIKKVRPDWVDVSSSVEIRPGKKNHAKVKKFIQVVRK